MKKLISLFAVVGFMLGGCGVVEESGIINDGNFVSEESESSAESSLSTSSLSETGVTTTAVSSQTGFIINSGVVSSEISKEMAEQNTVVVTFPSSQEQEQNDYETSPEEEQKTSVAVPAVSPEVKVISPEVSAHLAKMSLHEKVCQMFIVTPESLTGYDVVTYVDCAFHQSYSNYPVGGIILFAANIEDSAQTRALVEDMQNDAIYAGTGMFVAVDEEGGSITRIQSQLGTTAVSNMSYYGELNDYNTSFSVGEIIGGYLSDYGFNLDFAPVADVTISQYNELGSRIFSSDPEIVANMSAAVVQGLKSKGVCSTLKHFPGLGAGSANTHYGSVWIDRTYEQLASTEFVAFRGGINAGGDFVMVGHQITSAAGDNLPGDLSSVVVTDWLKNTLGFNGLAITDSQSMGAITNNYTSGDAAVRAIEAGIDVVLMPYVLSEAIDGVEQAVNSGRISEQRIDESVAKILEKKHQLGLF